LTSRSLLLLLAFALAACGAPGRSIAPEIARPVRTDFVPQSSQEDQEDQEAFFAELGREPRWLVGQSLLQGYVGVAYPDGVTLDRDGDPVTIEDDELDPLPVIGGGAQVKLAGQGLDFGVEALVSLAFRSDLEAFVVGGGGAVIALSADVLVVDVFGGPFLSKLFGDRVRVYAGAGPLLQFLEYSQEDDSGDLDDDGSGFGAGYYTRGGIEFLLPSGTLVGFGVRYSSSEVDLEGSLGDFDFEGVQAVITVSRGG